MSDTNGVDREFTRVEAAAFLTEIGRRMSPQRLATRATENLGPPFHKNGRGRSVTYKESELRAWAASPEARAKGGRGKRTRQTTKPQGTTEQTDLRALLREHIKLADLFASGDGSAMAGYQFARSIDMLRRMVSE